MTSIGFVVFVLGLGMLLYALASVGYFFSARPWMGVAFIGYVIGNLGLIGDALVQR